MSRRWRQKLLTKKWPLRTQIFETPNSYYPSIDLWQVRPPQPSRRRRMGLPQDCERHVRIETSGNHCKYGNHQAPWQVRLSSSPTHSRPLETQHARNNIHPCCWWFRDQIRIKTRRRTYPPSPLRQVYHFHGLGRILIHRNLVELGLHRQTCRLIHPKICCQSATQVQTSSPKIPSRQ